MDDFDMNDNDDMPADLRVDAHEYNPTKTEDVYRSNRTGKHTYKNDHIGASRNTFATERQAAQQMDLDTIDSILFG